MKQLHHYSQKFLCDRKILNDIAEAVSAENEIVVEIGSGDGRLSEHLRAACRHLYCIEIDARFCGYLKTRFSRYDNVSIVHADILRWPLTTAGEAVILVGNSPYHISKQLIRYCIGNRTHIKDAYLMFQREFVDKLCAGTSARSYCALSCFFQYYAKIEPLFHIPASCFSPAPRVESTFTKIRFLPEPYEKALDENFLFRVIETAFNQRRKKVVNSLAPYTGIAAVLTKLNIDSDVRAQDIPLGGYVRLANFLYRHKSF